MEKVSEGKAIALKKHDINLDNIVEKMYIVNLLANFPITINQYDFIYFSGALPNSVILYNQMRFYVSED